MIWPRVRTCLRVQEQKKICFSLLLFQRYEAKTKDELPFSWFLRDFSEHKIVHCGFMVAPSTFIFSGIVTIMKSSILEFWNFGITATMWRWLHLFTFLFCLIFGMFLLVSWWLFCMWSTIYLSIKMLGKKIVVSFHFGVLYVIL